MEHVIKVKRKALAANDEAAARLRQQFQSAGSLVVNLISSPGSGKTTLLEATIKYLDGRLTAAVLEGDIATERDADRIRALGVPAHQILTGGACHLDARQVIGALEKSQLLPADLLFIENVGN
ncbi:MAG: hydrogenase nickel incorporation protein HypB, partial [Acidobacteria bacterium]|nr:hydrogenase nickel incorporation protein HypB [Acidobacteriota bacterium]